MSCAQAYLIIKEAQERLGSNLRFVFRSFPLTKVRPHAYQAALTHFTVFFKTDTLYSQ
jgi:hypothetical protein